VQEFKVAAVFCAIVVAGFVWSRMSHDLGEQWRKEADEEARRTFQGTQWQPSPHAVPPGLPPNAPAWNPQQQRPLPPPVTMPVQRQR
jgi:hypothetical protein